MTDKRDVKYIPTPGYIYWLYDTDSGEGMTYYASQEARDRAAKKAIENHLDGIDWIEDIEHISAGVVTHRVVKTDVLQRPLVLDENGEDENGMYWGGDDLEKCEYEMVPFGAFGGLTLRHSTSVPTENESIQIEK